MPLERQLLAIARGIAEAHGGHWVWAKLRITERGSSGGCLRTLTPEVDPAGAFARTGRLVNGQLSGAADAVEAASEWLGGLSEEPVTQGSHLVGRFEGGHVLAGATVRIGAGAAGRQYGACFESGKIDVVASSEELGSSRC